MPAPMIPPITSIVASNALRRRASPESGEAVAGPLAAGGIGDADSIAARPGRQATHLAQGVTARHRGAPLTPGRSTGHAPNTRSNLRHVRRRVHAGPRDVGGPAARGS